MRKNMRQRLQTGWNSEDTRRWRYAIRLCFHLAAMGAKQISFKGAKRQYDDRQANFRWQHEEEL
jgi:hypothetical protein